MVNAYVDPNNATSRPEDCWTDEIPSGFYSVFNLKGWFLPAFLALYTLHSNLATG